MKCTSIPLAIYSVPDQLLPAALGKVQAGHLEFRRLVLPLHHGIEAQDARLAALGVDAARKPISSIGLIAVIPARVEAVLLILRGDELAILEAIVEAVRLLGDGGLGLRR